MDSKKRTSPLIVIIGETASGKSALALDLARRFGGEIICADSRTVYKGMDIGTAKPSVEDRSRVPHHLLDVVQPDESFSAADFKRLANQAIDDITSRQKLPIMVGGTGLYVDSVIFDYQFPPASNPTERQQLEKLTVDQLQQELRAKGQQLPFNERNPRHLIRALEIGGINTIRSKLRSDTLLLGVRLDLDQLRARIISRVDEMIAAGLADEVEQLRARYGWEIEPMKGIGYGEWQAGTDIDEVKARIVQHTLQLAKKQRTWFKRNNSIRWLNDPSEGVDIVTTFLSKLGQ